MSVISARLSLLMSGHPLMVKATISAVAMAALQVITAERALKIDRHLADMRVVSSDANSNQLKLGFKKAVVINLSLDIKEILVADPGTVKVILRTTRRVYIIGAALGKTNVFFYDDDGRQIIALDVWVSDIAQPQPPEFGESLHRQQRRDRYLSSF
jgi:pilus assembly protein CpaC